MSEPTVQVSQVSQGAPVFRSRWGFHPCDYVTYKKLRRLQWFFLLSFKRDAAIRRWDRKQPQNRVHREYEYGPEQLREVRFKDGRTITIKTRQRLGVKKVTPLARPSEVPYVDSEIVDLVQLCRVPCQRAEVARKLGAELDVGVLDVQLTALEAWLKKETK